MTDNYTLTDLDGDEIDVNIIVNSEGDDAICIYDEYTGGASVEKIPVVVKDIILGLLNGHLIVKRDD